ncbi:MAG: amino acid adenylation domain-containing protein, partial [Aquincola sp.]|nr:amino acid adenylation domain-containing protein [Aquincola sp.]
MTLLRNTLNAIHQGEFTCSPQQIQLAATSSRAAPTSFVRFEIEGALAVDAVAFAVRSLVERHESLRTRLVHIDGLALPVQRVLPPDAPLAVHLDTASQATSDTTASDRADGVPLEVSVLRRGSALCEVEIVAPAAHADCTSLGTVVTELFALLTGEQLGELPLQYPDITEWLCEQRSTDRAARLAAEWQEGGRLLARTQVLALEGRSDTDAPLRREIVLPRARLTALRVLGGGRADAAVLGCLAVLIARLARRDTVVIGVASSDRGLDELLGVVGALEGMLPACIPVEGHATLADCCRPQAVLLDRLVEEQFEGAWPRVEELRDGAGYPITYRYLHLPEERCAGSLAMRVLGLGASRGDARLHVGCTEGSDDLRVALDFDPSRFCRAAADEIAAQLKALLHAAEHPDALLSDLAVSPIGLADGPVAADVRATPLAHHLFEDFATRHPDAPAVTADGLAWSYARLDAEADAVAVQLGVAGARAGDVVGVCLRPGLPFAAALLGVLKAGCVYLPLEPNIAAARMAHLLEDARPFRVLTAAGLLPTLPAAQRIEHDPAGMPAPSRAARAVVRDPGDPSRPAYVIYTSGSTGRPKGVVVSHRALVQYVRGLLARLKLPAGSTFACLSGIGADLGHTSLFGALLGGGHLHLVPDTEQIDAEALKARFAASPVDCLKIVPSHLAALVAGPDAAALLPRRALVLGGEALPRSLVERVTTMRPGCRVWNHYGPTETTVGALMLDVAAEDDGLAATVPIGFALDGYLVQIVDEQLRPVVDGTVGELLIGGAAVASGYLGQPALTAERFLTLPLGIAYRTGDLVRRRGNGSIEYLGRNDDQVKIRGYRVEPGEVRGALLAQPDVVDAYVGPLEGPAGDAILVAWIVPRAGARPSASVLRAFLEGRLAGPMIPSEIVACESLPLLANGKVDRKALAARRGNAGEGTRHLVPRPGLETQIAELWAPLLARESIGRGDDFFLLGGHSLLAAQVVSRMRSQFGLDVTLRTLFEHPTVETLAVALAAIATAPTATAAVAPLRRADMSQPQPLSYSQQRLWVLAQIEEHGSLYNIPAALRLDGPIDAQALQRALDSVVHRQASLRTRFFDTPDGPRQQVMDEVRIELQIRDVEREAVAAEIERHARTQFDLGEPGLLRIALLRLAPLEHVLLICLHHIVSDGWSSGILIRELGAFYDAQTGGTSTPPPALEHHYLDFAVWQRQAGDAGIAQDLETQVSHLQGAPALLELPTDFPRPPMQSFRGATVPVHVPRPVLTGLVNLARRNGATLFMVLSAALRVLLARYSSQDDISIGTPVANRSRVETEGLIGCFINTVVVRRRVAWELPFIEELASERDVVLQALAADSVPFERLVERLAPQRTLAQSPLFQVMLILQNAPSVAVRLRGVAIEALDIPHPPAKFDLTFDLKETADGLEGRLEFARDLFRSETASDLVRRLGLLLSHVAAEGAVATCDLQVIDPGERERMLHAWNPPFTQVPEPRLLHVQFEAQAARTPARTALYLDGRGITYGELARACDEFAGYLHATGPVAGGVIGICLERGFDAIVATIATLKVGAAFVPMDPALPAQRLAWMAEDSGVDIVVAARASRERLPKDVRCLVLEDLPPHAPHRVAGLSSASDSSLAYILFTSGSTGRPKGVMGEHRNVANFFVGMDALMPEPAQTWLAATSQSFDISILELLWTLCRGHTTVVWRDDASATALAHARRPMDFSLFYFATDRGEVGADKYRLLVEGARFADDQGFSAVWTPERHFGGFGGLYPNPAITGAAISTITRRIGIRSGSLVLPLHNAVRVAEDWSVID